METDFIGRVLAALPAKFSRVLESAEDMRLQVLLSYVSRGRGGRPVLCRHGFRVDHEYFYPASAIKICAAIAALQKIQKLPEDLPGTEMLPRTALRVLPVFKGDVEQAHDASNLDKGHSVNLAHDIRKLFLVSDNDAFNRLYSFVGHRSINQAMWSLGLPSTRIHHRLSVERSTEENRVCEAVVIGNHWCSAPKRSRLQLPATCAERGIHVGSAYIDLTGKQVEEPMDFSKKNAMSLVDLQNVLVKALRPDIDIGTPGLELDENLRQLLLEAMVQYPSQSRNPKYDAKDYPDDYCKFFLPGLARVRPQGALRVYNKIGQAYGFSTDNSYILDIETGQSFFLSASLYTNKNGILNDDKYEYDLAYEVFADIAEVLTRAIWKDDVPKQVSLLSSICFSACFLTSSKSHCAPMTHCTREVCQRQSSIELMNNLLDNQLMVGNASGTDCWYVEGAEAGNCELDLPASGTSDKETLVDNDISSVSISELLPYFKYFVDS